MLFRIGVCSFVNHAITSYSLNLWKTPRRSPLRAMILCPNFEGALEVWVTTHTHIQTHTQARLKKRSLRGTKTSSISCKNRWGEALTVGYQHCIPPNLKVLSAIWLQFLGVPDEPLADCCVVDTGWYRWPLVTLPLHFYPPIPCAVEATHAGMSCCRVTCTPVWGTPCLGCFLAERGGRDYTAEAGYGYAIFG